MKIEIEGRHTGVVAVGVLAVLIGGVLGLWSIGPATASPISTIRSNVGAAVLGEGATIVDQGQPGNQGAWQVTMNSGLLSADAGAVAVYEQAHAACVNTTMTIGTTGTACPASAMANRKSIMIELVQTGETLTVTSDGTTTATATLGLAVADGNAYVDNLVGSVATNCRCTAASCSLRILECP